MRFSARPLLQFSYTFLLVQTHRIIGRFAERGMVRAKEFGNTNEVVVSDWVKEPRRISIEKSHGQKIPLRTGLKQQTSYQIQVNIGGEALICLLQ